VEKNPLLVFVYEVAQPSELISQKKFTCEEKDIHY